MKCGYCGSPVSAECGTAKNGERKRYYKCLGRKNGNGCKKSQARKEVLDNAGELHKSQFGIDEIS